MKVKVKIYPCAFEYCATLFSEDAKKILETIDECKRRIREVFPLADFVDIEIDGFIYGLSESDLRKGIVGYMDADQLGCKTLEEFIEDIKKILERRKIEYEIEVV